MNKIVTSLLLAICITQGCSKLYGQVGIENLFFNSYDTIIMLDFSTGSPNVVSTGILAGFEGIAHVEDGFGNILFWVNANGVYDGNGVLMPGSIGLLATPSSSEINVCPFPNDTTKYYIFYNAETCSPLYYSVVDMTMRSGDGDISQLNVLLDAGNHAEGMEVIRIPCTNNFWYVTYECFTGFKRFLVDSSGIGAGVLIHNYIQPLGYDGRGELDYHNNKIGLAFAYANHIFTASFDPIAGLISNALDIAVPNVSLFGPYGLEFSPDASKVYFDLWYDPLNNNVFQYDFNTQNINGYNISTSGWGLGQIELGPDERLYLIHDGSYQITTIDNPNSLNPVFGLINVNSELALGISDHIQSDVLDNESDFNYSLTCDDYSVQFNAYNSGTSCANTWLWYFGDGDSSSLQSPLHSYDSSGNYTVTLLAFHSTGTDTIIKVINVGSIRVPDFTYVTICQGTVTVFTDITPCNPVSWQWNFGDGSPIDTSASPSHLYNSAGDYIVTLIATWGDGYQDSIIKTVTILADTGNANFNFDALCPDWVQFIDSSLGGPTSWFWDFGDSLGTDTVQHPSYWFAYNDTFNVTLIVTYDNGCPPDTILKPVIIAPNLNVSFPTYICVGDTVNVSITIAGNTTGVNYTYLDFGDGYWIDSLGFIQNAAHVYDSAGTYPVWFEIYYGGWWCYEYVEDSITVYPSITANFLSTVDSICNGDSVLFTDISVGNITNWSWDFGDGSPLDSSQNAAHFYNSSGIYEVSLWITNSAGCSDTITKFISVFPGMALSVDNPDFTCNGPCGWSVTATPNGGAAPYSYFWNNGQTTQTAIGLCAGVYTITVIDSNGCQEMNSVTIDSLSSLTSDTVNVTDVLCKGYCDGVAIATIEGGSPPYTYLWDGGTTPTDSSATGLCAGVLYTLLVTDAIGCDTVTTSIMLSEPDSLNLSITSNNNVPCINSCDGELTVTPVGGILPYTYVWDPVSPGQNDSIGTSLCMGTYTITVSDANGCVDTISHTLVMNSSLPSAEFIITPQQTTLLNSISFTNLSFPDVDSLAHYWDFGDGITDTVVNPVHSYSNSGTYSVMLIVSDSNGCADTVFYTVTVEGGYILFAPNTFTPNGDGHNEVFIPIGVGIDNDNFEMYIYDRWGNLIYKTIDINEPWDGKANGGRKIAQQDVYVWIVYTRDIFGKRHRYMGHVNLVR